MKIAVLNFSGNVGKTTVARHLLLPRLDGAEILSVESVNSDGGETTTLRGKAFGRIQEHLQSIEHAIVDVGASNADDVVKLMAQYRGSHEDFDYFVVPTTPSSKQQRDTVSTLDALSALGVAADRVRVVFNMVELEDEPRDVFRGLYQYWTETRRFPWLDRATIHVNELYGLLRDRPELTIRGVLEDPTDYKARIRASEDPEEKQRLARLLSIRRLASGVAEELDAVFATLFHSP